MDITGVIPPIEGSFEQLTVTTAVKTLTATKYSGLMASERKRGRNALMARITLDPTNGIRYTVDGTNPSLTLGHPVLGGAEILLEGYNAIKAFKAFRSGGADAIINVTYYGV